MHNHKIKISGTGCALADFLYEKVDFHASGFQKYLSNKTGDGGLSPGKLVFTSELETFAKRPYSEILGDIVQGKEYHGVNLGGPSLVSLIHTSQLLPKEHFEVSFYGCTGADETSTLILEKVAKTPLNCKNYIALGVKNTAFTHVLSDPNFDGGHGERTFINNIGASWDYQPQMLPQSFFEADLVCFGGTALVPQIHDNLTMLLKKAKTSNAITIVNTVFDFRNENENPNEKWRLVDSDENYRFIDVLLMDCEEALKISGTSTIHEAAVYFELSGVSSFIITSGSQNLLAYSNGTLFKPMDISIFQVSSEIVRQLRMNPSAKGDTTGCGDNFTGGIIASVAIQINSRTRGEFDMIDSISWGVSSGGFACFYLGGTWFEKTEGEKKALIEPYRQKYLKQIGYDI
jgi:sugar/nucleoside kinase (ribokinase family)